MPGGVSSPVRSFASVGGDPLVFERGTGSKIFDVDGGQYIDYVMSYGPLLFGHAPKFVTDAIILSAQRGATFGATSPGEIELARKIVRMVPSVEKVRFVSSGTEAVMSAVRAARGFTKRSLVIKFEGCYHGHSDAFLSKAGSGVATLDLPGSAGVPSSFTQETITLPYNNISALSDSLSYHKGEVACVIIEPLAANMGVVPPKEGYLEAVRHLTRREGAVLIFDEVITGFRLADGGAQKLFGVTPDMTTLGKIVGGGLPLAAYGGRSEIMDMVAPVGPVYQAGTLSGNPVAAAAGIAALSKIEETESLYEDLASKTKTLATELQNLALKMGAKAVVNSFGSLFTIFMTDLPVCCYEDAKRADTRAYASFFWEMLKNGISLAPSQFEAGFVSTAHNDDDIEATLRSAEKAFAVCSKLH